MARDNSTSVNVVGVNNGDINATVHHHYVQAVIAGDHVLVVSDQGSTLVALPKQQRPQPIRCETVGCHVGRPSRSAVAHC